MLLTPNWSTHGHGNHSKACAYWLDFLDAPLVQLLEPMFFEVAGRGGRSWRATESSAGLTGTAAGTDPLGIRSDHAIRPLCLRSRRRLRRLGETKPDPDRPFATQIELGHPALATTALYMMELAPGTPHRALSHHGEQHLRRGRGDGHHDGRRRAVRLAPRRRGGGAGVAAALARGLGRCHPVPRHRRAGDAALRLVAGGTAGGRSTVHSPLFTRSVKRCDLAPSFAAASLALAWHRARRHKSRPPRRHGRPAWCA